MDQRYLEPRNRVDEMPSKAQEVSCVKTSLSQVIEGEMNGEV